MPGQQQQLHDIALEVSARALTSLHLYLSSHSPLNTAQLAAEAVRVHA